MDALTFQSFLEDKCWTCRREPSCAKMLTLRDKGKAIDIVERDGAYECSDYRRQM